MNIRRGFTLVELMIAMIVMVILLAVTLVNISSSQSSARGKATVARAEMLARALENRYNNGNPKITTIPAVLEKSIRPGTYPGLDEFNFIQGMNMGYMGSIGSAWQPKQISGGYMSEFLLSGSKDSANDNIVIINGSIRAFGSDSGDSAAGFTKMINTLYYEAVDAENKVCEARTSPCVSFNIYYIAEGISPVAQTIRSKHR